MPVFFLSAKKRVGTAPALFLLFIDKALRFPHQLIDDLPVDHAAVGAEAHALVQGPAPGVVGVAAEVHPVWCALSWRMRSSTMARACRP